MAELSKEAEQLISEHISIANSIASQMWRTAPHALELDELKSLAYYGLVMAASRWPSYCYSCHNKNCKLVDCTLPEHQYDPSATQFFTTFAVRRMRGAIVDSLRSTDWATRSLRTKVKQLQQVDQGQGLTDKELSERTGMPLKDVQSTMVSIAQRPVSLDGSPGVFEAQVQDTEGVASGHDMLSTVRQAFESCTPEEKVVLAMHYHLQKELQEIAVIMGITGSYASQLHTKGVMTIYSALLESLSDTVNLEAI